MRPFTIDRLLLRLGADATVLADIVGTSLARTRLARA